MYNFPVQQEYFPMRNLQQQFTYAQMVTFEFTKAKQNQFQSKFLQYIKLEQIWYATKKSGLLEFMLPVNS